MDKEGFEENLKSQNILFFMNILRDGAGMINREIGFVGELKKRGYNVSILSYFRPQKVLDDPSIPVDRVFRTNYHTRLYENPLFFPLAFILVFLKFLKFKPDIVFVDLAHENRWANIFRPIFSYKVISTYHGVAESRFYSGETARQLDLFRDLSYKHLRKSDHIIVVSDFLLEETNKLGLHARRLHNGVDAKRCNPGRRVDGLRADKPLITFIGRYTEYKGAMNVVRAFKIVQEAIPEAQLLMHGFMESGGYIDEIKGFLEDHSLKDNVYMFGPLDGAEMPYRMNASNLFINGSLYETFCMPLLEAQACGVACVAFAEGGIPEVVLDKKTGLLAKGESIEEYAQHIITLLRDPDLRRSYAKNALEHALTFTYDKLTDQLLTILHEEMELK